MIPSNQVLSQSRQDIVKGSKSFAMASLFFSEEQKQGAWQLYAWCRHCDDQVDQFEGAEALKRCNELELKTREVFNHVPMTTHPWEPFQWVMKAYNVPDKYALDLLRGMRWDVEGARIESLDDLFDYCYFVAGTVGLMMCHVMGLSRESALNQAVDLGIALQLTNISRDIREDLERGRIYLPATWLREFGLDSKNLMAKENRRSLKILVDRLLKMADERYANGLKGLDALPFRSALAVQIAALIYRDIGTQVRNGGLTVFDHRVIVSKPRKIFLAVQGLIAMIVKLPSRMKNPWRPTPLQKVWGELEGRS